MSERRAPWGWVLLALAVAAADQLTKAWMLGLLQPGEVRPLAPVFNLVLTFNTGAAFSLLHDAGGWQRWLFILLTLGVSGLLLAWLWRSAPGAWLEQLALSLVLGGALGNVIDRIRLGRVTDFLDFHWRQWHWPAFNLADSAITVGVVLLLIASWRSGGKR